MVIIMIEIKPLNVQFVKDYIDFLRGDVSKIEGLLNYAFYLLIKKKDELSLNFAYSIIINYTLKFKDYNPLIEFSIIFGYSPILNIIYNKIGVSTDKEIENFIEIYVNLQYTIITLSLVPGVIKGTSYMNNASYVTTWR